MSAKSQRGIILRAYPDGVPTAADFDVVERPVAEPAENQVLVETRFLSLDPLPRLRMSATARDVPPLALGSLVPGRGVGVVRSSRSDALHAGDVVTGDLGWQQFATVAASTLRRVDPALGPVSTALGILGPSGITAWCLTYLVAHVRRGDTVVVTAAAGAVGSTLVQLAKLEGARVVALVASEPQAESVRNEIGADAVIDCKAASFASDLDAALPSGASVFLDSVGGAVHEAVVERIAVHGRIVAFGYISAYNDASGSAREYGRMFRIIHRRASLHGFLVGDHVDRFDEALQALAHGLREGKLRALEHCVDGLEQTPAAFARLFTGDPVGKQLVRLAPP